jgi:catechol 2,3-dioxygenase-like lactoylglutathione lyase family enzyme
MPDDTADVRPLLDLVVIDCPDPHALAEFYGAVLGWLVEGGSDDDWVVLSHPEGGVTPDRPEGRTSIGFQRIDDYVAPTWPGGAHPQQFHLDLAVESIEKAEPAVLALGARVAAEQPSETGSFKVYLDPAGHPFCLCRQG